MRGVGGLFAGACVAIVVACASSHRSAMLPTAPPQSAGASSPHDEIARLSAEIDQQRETMGLPIPAAHAAAVSMAGGTNASSVDATCHPAPSDTCKQSCTLSDSICDNAKKICDLAQQLTGDAWAAQKCTDGTATCDASHKRCCECAS